MEVDFIEAIANLMKKSYLVWNRNTVDDHVILKELDLLSNGKLKVSDDFQLNSTNDILARTRNMNPPIRPEESRGRDRDRGRDRGRHGHGRNNNRHRRGR